MSDHDTSSDPPRTAYLRSVTFLDHPSSAGVEHPVHVTYRVLFEGTRVGFVGRRWHIESGEAGEMLLYLDVDSAAVTTNPDAADKRLAYRLGDYPVLLPAEIDGTDDDGAIISRTPTCWRDNGDGTHTVAIFVENVHVLPCTFGDTVEDGGVKGTIVRCHECGGTGQLHDPYQGTAPTATRPNPLPAQRGVPALEDDS